MNVMPANEFLTMHTSAYGMSWKELFDLMISHPYAAKHMAEFIDDVEIYGQQTPVYVDREGMVSEGNKLAMALDLLGMDVEYEYSDYPDDEPGQLWIVEFEHDNALSVDVIDNLVSILSFRVESDWVVPIDGDVGPEEGVIIMLCESGAGTASRLPQIVYERLARVGAKIHSVQCSEYTPVDDEANEW